MGCRLKVNPETLFVAFFEVAAPADKKSGPQIVFQYPAGFDDAAVTKELPKFCFPCDLSRYNPAGQFFTFVLTGLDNKQRFGFCRHPPGAAKCLCILSYLPWFEIFYKILNQLAELKIHKKDDIAQQVIAKLYETAVPPTNEKVHISVPSQDDSGVEVIFTGPNNKALPSIPEQRNITEYFSAVNHTNMMILFASLLFERRILITSDKLSRLTACVHSAASLLYPLYWQHIYIPVMPTHLIDYCCAPMPFLVGVHSSFMPQVKKMALDEVVILNADTNSIDTPFNDLQTLPPEAVNQLKKNLKNSFLFTGDGVARSFLKVLVYLLGGYREAVRVKIGSELMFDADAFVQCRSSHMQPFLEKLLHLQHFTQFIDSRVQLLSSGEPINDLFEEELEVARRDGSLSSKNLKETLKTHLTTVRTDGKKILKDVQKNVQQKVHVVQAQGSKKSKANPEAMKEFLKQSKDFAKGQYIGIKTKLIKGKETEDLDMSPRQNHRQTAYLDISLPLPVSSAPASPSASPQSSPLANRAGLDVRRKTTSNASRKLSEENARPRTVAVSTDLPQLSKESHPPSLPLKSKSYRQPSQASDDDPLGLVGASGQDSSGMNLMKDLQEVLQKISSYEALADLSSHEVAPATSDTPVPMPRRRRVHRESPTSGGRNMQRPLIPPPPIPPRRERRTQHSSHELVNITDEEQNRGFDKPSQTHGLAVQNALGTDCEDHTLTFQSVHANNNAQGEYYTQENIPRNSSAQTLLADYGLNFRASEPACVSPPKHGHLSVPGLRATSSSPNLQTYSSQSPYNLVQQVLVQQPPSSTLPDLLNPSGSTQPMTAPVKMPSTQPFQIQHTPLQPVAASENPFRPKTEADPTDPFADLVSFQLEGAVASQSWKK